MIDEFRNRPIRDVTIGELCDALADRPDDFVIRYFQTSTIDPSGVPQAGDTLRLTLGQLRRERA